MWEEKRKKREDKRKQKEKKTEHTFSFGQNGSLKKQLVFGLADSNKAIRVTKPKTKSLSFIQLVDRK